MCTESNGIELSVISALARIDVDPWEEADRLATMPKPTARKALISTLNRATGKDWNSEEAAAVAARLLELLPERTHLAPTNVAALDLLRRQLYWLPWLALALALSFFVHRAGPTNAGVHSPDSHEISRSSDANAEVLPRRRRIRPGG